MFTNKNDFTIEPHCPWYNAQQTFGNPNIKWCEPTICSYINEPANAWSNLGYVFAGILILKSLNKLKDKMLKEFGLIIILMGLFSFIYHATNNYLTQFLDFFGMFFLTSFMLAQGILRVRNKNPRNYYKLFFVFMVISISAFWLFTALNTPIQYIVAIEVLPMIGLELYACHKEKRLNQTKWFAWALLFLIIAKTFSILDHKRIWCESENIFLHGHALWHIFGGVSMFFLGKHVKRMLEKF